MTGGGASRFVLLCQGRTGSSWLTDALAAHPAIEVRGEVLAEIAPLGALAQLHWCQAFFAKYAGGVTACGFKTKLSDVVDTHGFAGLLRDYRCRVIHLERLDLVKQAVSWIRADLLFERTGKHNIEDVQDKVPPTALDVLQFRDRYAQLLAGRRALAEYVAALGVPVHRVTYEALFADPERALRDLQTFLSVPSLRLASPLAKHTSDDLISDVPNIEALLASVHMEHVR